MVPMKSACSEGVLLGVISHYPPDINNSKWGTQNPQNLGSGNSFLFIPSDVGKCWIICWNYFSKPTKSGGVIGRKRRMGGSRPVEHDFIFCNTRFHKTACVAWLSQIDAWLYRHHMTWNSLKYHQDVIPNTWKVYCRTHPIYFTNDSFHR